MQPHVQPPIIATTFSAMILMHGPGRLSNHTFDRGVVAVDADRGLLRKQNTDFYTDPKVPETSDFFIDCVAGKAYYVQTDPPGNCTAYTVRASQCPISYPGVHIPPNGAQLLRSEMANGLECDVWQFYYPTFQSNVQVWVSKPAPGDKDALLVRFLGARVQTDYTNISRAADAIAFRPPQSCSNTSVVDDAPTVPPLLMEVGRSVSVS